MRSAVTQLCVTKNAAHGGFVQGSKMSPESERSQKLSGHIIVLTLRHRQLTSTLIAKRLMGILQREPNMKVRTIIRTVEALYGGYVLTYGKAWRAKQRAWKMIYRDWEDGYEQLLVLFNAFKVVNPGIHYEYIPKPNAWKDRMQIFFHAFWCFP